MLNRAPTLDLNTFHDRSVRLLIDDSLFFLSNQVEGRSEQEKDRLANMMAYGVDPNQLALQRDEPTPSPPPEIDRFDECEKNSIVSLIRYVCFLFLQWFKKSKNENVFSTK